MATATWLAAWLAVHLCGAAAEDVVACAALIDVPATRGQRPAPSRAWAERRRARWGGAAQARRKHDRAHPRWVAPGRQQAQGAVAWVDGQVVVEVVDLGHQVAANREEATGDKESGRQAAAGETGITGLGTLWRPAWYEAKGRHAIHISQGSRVILIEREQLGYNRRQARAWAWSKQPGCSGCGGPWPGCHTRTYGTAPPPAQQRHQGTGA